MMLKLWLGRCPELVLRSAWDASVTECRDTAWLMYHAPHITVCATEGGTQNARTAACDTKGNTQDMVDCETITYKFCTQGAGRSMLEQSC